MDKIHKELENIISLNKYNDYRIVITKSHLEVKITPESDSETEHNWYMYNDEYGREVMLTILQEFYRNNQ